MSASKELSPHDETWIAVSGQGRRAQSTRRIANILRALDDASRPEDINCLPGGRRHAGDACRNWWIGVSWSDGVSITGTVKEKNGHRQTGERELLPTYLGVFGE
jgi:toxin HigB-1